MTKPGRWPATNDIAAHTEISERLLKVSADSGQPVTKHLRSMQAYVKEGHSWIGALRMVEQNAQQLTIFDYLEGRVNIGE